MEVAGRTQTGGDGTPSPGRGSILLVSEARQEFLTAERLRKELAGHGWPTIHVTAQASDASVDELSGGEVIALDSHTSFTAACRIRDPRRGLEHLQREFGVNLRRRWQADFRHWREGFSDSAMARLSLGYFAAWKTILEDSHITCMWSGDVGHLAKQAAFLTARCRGIPTWFLDVCPLPNRLVVLENQFTWTDSDEFYRTDPTAEEAAVAERFLSEFRSGHIDYATRRDLSFTPGRGLRFMQLLVDRFVRRPPGSAMLYPLTFARLYAKQRAAAAITRFRRQSMGRAPFFFFPIHFARDTFITLRAPQWENQLALIEHLAASLPFGYELAIKEHPFEVGALPPRALHSLLRRHPQIRLLDPRLDARPILTRCTALATVNSTTGFEALFVGKPVVTFGQSLYRGLGLTHDVRDPFDTPRVMLEASNSSAPSEDALIRFLTFLYRRSYPGTNLGLDNSDANVVRVAAILAELAARSEAASRSGTSITAP